jgi:hypothetical protein
MWFEKRGIVSALVFAGAMVGAACSDSTGPGASRHPIVGSYDVTTTLQSYAYPTNCATSCTMNVVSAGPARLSGTMTIGDSVVTTASGVRLPLYSAVMHENPCDGTQPPCTGGTFDRTTSYTTGYQDLTVSGDTMGVTGALGASGETLVITSGTFAADSIVGTLRWHTFLGVASEYYDGTFVARRKR